MQKNLTAAFPLQEIYAHIEHAKMLFDDASNICENQTMKKSEIIRLIGNAPEIARRLKYAHRNVVYGWPDELSKRQSDEVIMRMKAHRIPVPKDWL